MATTETNVSVSGPPRLRFHSRYRHGIDDKRRLQIPAKWRPKDADLEFVAFVWPEPPCGPCLRVLPPAEVDNVVTRMETTTQAGDHKSSLRRYVGSNSDQFWLDGTGRMALSEEMLGAAGLAPGQDAMLVGCLNYFEVWAPERYERTKGRDQVHAEDLKKVLE